MNWKKYLKEKRNRIELVVTLVLFATILSLFANFLNFIETRNGVVLPDPILSLFNPVDFTGLIFSLIYLSIIIGLLTLINNPKRLIFTLQLYTLLILVRMIAMYLLPLNPPIKIIILDDPFVQLFGNGNPLTKDLFFSGHTAILFMLFLVSEKKIFKTFFLISTTIVAIAILVQHVHYTIDVFAAFFFTYACYKAMQELNPL